MRPFYLTLLCLCCATVSVHAEDLKVAEDHRNQGIVALQESQNTPRQIVSAARHFAKAAAIFEKLGDTDGAVEMNSFLYWCKKKMTLDDIEAFTKAGEAAVTEKLKAVDAQKVEKTDAQTWYDRAENFAKAKPAEHLLIAIRFFEVAERFKGTDPGMSALDRSLKEMQQIKAPAAKPDVAQPAPARPAVEPAVKVAVPDAVKLKDAEKTIKDIFKDEFAKRGADDKKALGQKLLQQASETKDDPVSRYVLLKEASAAASAGADAETALKALDALGQHYELDALALKADALGKILPTTADAAKALARVYLKVIDDAVAADNYDAAVKLATAADTVARKAQDMPLVTQLQARGKEVRALQTDFAKVKAAQATLKDKPDDPDANLAVGKFLCFSKGAWETGLPLLSNGSDLKLKELAQKDRSKPQTPNERATIGDEWRAFANNQGVVAKKIIQQRAIVWYGLAMKDMTGLQRAKYEKHVAEIGAGLPKTAAVWISNKATYTASSVRKGWQSPSLLDGTGGGAYDNSFAFHTDDPATSPPFIVIDLQKISSVSEIGIVNRVEGKERAKTLTIWVGFSNDGPWEEVWTASDVKLEWRAVLSSIRVARFIKIGLKEKTPLHLHSVKVFGEQLE